MTTALFSGRFQPPHLGHVLTLMDIYSKYSKIIVAVTNYTYEGKKPHVLPRNKVKEILERAFQHLPKIQVVFTEEGFPVRKTFDDLPPFDVVVTGNKTTIKNMKELGIQTHYVPRAEGLGFDGTILRELYGTIGMTIAVGLMRLEKSFKGMVDLHRLEIANHEKIRIDALRKADEIGGSDPIYATILRLEAYRNLEHKKCHERMVTIYSGVDGENLKS